MRRIHFILIVLFLVCGNSFLYSKNKRIASVPFELTGSYIVVEVKINDSSPLKMILDTGIKNTIITELLSTDSVSLVRTDTITINGLGNEQDLKAYQSFKNDVKIGRINFTDKNVLLMMDNTFNFTSYSGQKINGIIGTDILQDYIIEINYTNSRIYFYDYDGYVPPSSFVSIPATIENDKIFIYADVVNQDLSRKKVKMLIDTGAELGAWLQNIRKNSVVLPEKKRHGYIGQGLSGEILGNYTHLNQICLGPFCIKNPIVSFPDSIFISHFILRSDRDGTFGNQIMKRFNNIIDFKKPAIYLKPNFMFNDKSRYNIAGIEIMKEPPFLILTKVNKVWEDSPADKKGIKEGDIIIEVDWQKTFQMKLSEIRMLFETPRRFPLQLLVERDNQTFEVHLDMNMTF